MSWWQLDGDWSDAIGTNTGVPSGNPSFETGEVGDAVFFDGNDSVMVPASSSLNVGTGNGFTIEAWIKPAEVSSQQPLIEWNNHLGFTGPHLWLSVASLNGGPGSLYANLVDTTGGSHLMSTDPGLVVPNIFQHVALTYDKSSGVAAIYLNGAVVAQTNLGSFAVATSLDLYFGTRPYAEFYHGSMDEVGLYNRALTSAEVQSLYAAGTSGKCLPNQLTVPSQYESIEAEGYSGVITEAVREQTVYSASHFPPVPIMVREIRFRPNAAGGPAGQAFATTISQIQVNLSATTSSPDALSSTFGDNVGPNETIVFHGSLAVSSAFSGPSQGPKDADIRIPFATPFLYDPAAGNLLVDIRNFSGEATTLVDASSSSSDSVSRVTSLNVSSAVGVPDTGGDVLKIVYGLAETNLEPVILYQPASQSVDIGATVTFSVLAVGQSPLSYQWRLEDVDLAGETNVSLVLTNVETNQIGNYTVLVTNDYGSVLSSNATLSLRPPVPPVIVTQPQNHSTLVGGDVTFAVSADGTEPLSYQWRFNETNLGGATNATLTLSGVQMSQAGAYSVEVTNIAGSVISSNAILTVAFPPAVVRVVGTNSPAANTVTVPVLLVANGNEYALGCSLNISTPRYGGFLVNATSVSPGSGNPGAALFVNTNELTSGKLGIQIIAPPFTTFAAGTQEIARVTLVVSNVTVSSQASIGFGDQPITRQLIDDQGNVLPANFQSSAFVSVAPAFTLEGDVSPRPNGDRIASLSDWLLTGRLAAGLDAPANPGEFQRADCAPRSTLGDGRISVADWVQSGRYASGWDFLTPAGGPTEEIPNSVTDSQSRLLRINDVVLEPGQSGTLSVKMEAQGDENAVGFSLAFDPAVVSFISATPGSDVAGAALLINTNQIGAGELGVALALPTGVRLEPGSKEVIKLNLRSVLSEDGSATLEFSDQPADREASDVSGNALALGFDNALITIHPFQPALTIALQEESVDLSWPLWAGAFNLQSSETLPPMDGWTNVVATPQTNGDRFSVSLPVGQSPRFFRLSMP